MTVDRDDGALEAIEADREQLEAAGRDGADTEGVDDLSALERAEGDEGGGSVMGRGRPPGPSQGYPLRDDSVTAETSWHGASLPRRDGTEPQTGEVWWHEIPADRDAEFVIAPEQAQCRCARDVRGSSGHQERDVADRSWARSTPAAA